MQGSNRKTITANSVRLHHHLFKVVGPFQVDVTHGHPWKGMQTCEESPKHKTPLQGGPENPGLTDGLTLTFGLVRIHRQPQNSCPGQPKILTFHTEDAFPLGPGWWHSICFDSKCLLGLYLARRHRRQYVSCPLPTQLIPKSRANQHAQLESPTKFSRKVKALMTASSKENSLTMMIIVSRGYCKAQWRHSHVHVHQKNVPL